MLVKSGWKQTSTVLAIVVDAMSVHVSWIEGQVRIEFVFVRTWHGEEEANKRTKQQMRVRKEDLSSFVPSAKPLLSLVLILDAHTRDALWVHFLTKRINAVRHHHIRAGLKIVSVRTEFLFEGWAVYGTAQTKRVASQDRKEWLYDDDERPCHEKPDRFLKVDDIIIPHWTRHYAVHTPLVIFDWSLYQRTAQ